MKKEAVNWPEAVKPLLKKYENKPHPLEAKNVYQYLVLVVLSAQSNDNLVNAIAPALFEAFPDMEALSQATPEALYPYVSKIINFRNKVKWLTAIAASIKEDSNIPLSMDALVKFSGIGRKSANVILRGAGAPAEGIIVDLHVLRVAPRLGIAQGDDAIKMEKQLMEVLPKKQWDIGMAISFLGREICRPKPECDKCLMNKVCDYFNNYLGGSVGGRERALILFFDSSPLTMVNSPSGATSIVWYLGKFVGKQQWRSLSPQSVTQERKVQNRNSLGSRNDKKGCGEELNFRFCVYMCYLHNRQISKILY